MIEIKDPGQAYAVMAGTMVRKPIRSLGVNQVCLCRLRECDSERCVRTADWANLRAEADREANNQSR